MSLIVVCLTTYAQVGIGTNAPSASAALEVNSKTQDFLMPRMRKAQMEAIKAPAEGLMVYCLDCTPKGFHVYNGRGFINANTGEYLDGPDKIAAIVAASTVPAAGGTPSLADLAAAHVTNATGNQAAYEEAIARASPVPTTLREFQGIVDFVNDAFDEIWEDSYGGGKNANGTLVSYEQLEAIGVKHLHPANLEFYQKDILLETGFSKPPTVMQIQAVIDKTTVIVDVTSATGRIWMDRNLGAKRAATSPRDEMAYGDYYQWGRNTDGHEKRNSAVVPGSVSSVYKDPEFVVNNSDWLSEKDDKRWNSGTDANPIKTKNDPCPIGYRVPTSKEIQHEIDFWRSKNADGAFTSSLKLPLSGYRVFFGSYGLSSVGSYGGLWSSTINGSLALDLGFANSYARFDNGASRAYGVPVRCIKE